MIMDYKLVLADAQAETTVAAHDTTNIIDLGEDGDAYDNLWAVFRVDTDFATSASGVVTFGWYTSSNGSSWTEILRVFTATAAADLDAGDIFKVKLPVGVKRYIKGVLTIGTGVLTAGKFDAFLVKDVEIRHE